MGQKFGGFNSSYHDKEVLNSHSKVFDVKAERTRKPSWHWYLGLN